MSSDPTRTGPTREPVAGGSVPSLSNQDLDRLTTYKWRYALESLGFSTTQAARLLFMRWLYARGGVQG